MGSCGIVTMSHCASLKTGSTPGGDSHCASPWVPPLGCQPATPCSDKTCLLAPGPPSCERQMEFVRPTGLAPSFQFSLPALNLNLQVTNSEALFCCLLCTRNWGHCREQPSILDLRGVKWTKQMREFQSGENVQEGGGQQLTQSASGTHWKEPCGESGALSTTLVHTVRPPNP
jgi:hypothetical protein